MNVINFLYVWFKELPTSCRSLFEYRRDVFARTLWALKATKANRLTTTKSWSWSKIKISNMKKVNFHNSKNIEVHNKYYCRFQSLIKDHKRIMIARVMKSQAKKESTRFFYWLGTTQFNHSGANFDTQKN